MRNTAVPLSLVLKPTIFLVILMCIVQYSGLDHWLAQNIYQVNDGWGLKNHWLVETVIHRGGRYLVITMVSMMLIAVVLSYLPRFKHNKYLPLSRYLLLSTALAILAVAVFKQTSNLPCPWDMSMFGGNKADIKIHEVFSAELANGHCFPSGHASGGYALFSFYFAAFIACYTGIVKKSNKWLTLMLAPGLLTGLTFGVAQQLRGAHLLSHDLTTAAVCWLVCGLTSYLFLPKKQPQEVYYAKLSH